MTSQQTAMFNPGEVAIFVTGDHRDFGHLFGQVLEGVKVLTPADTLEAVT